MGLHVMRKSIKGTQMELPVEQQSEDGKDDGGKSARRGNVFMRKLEPEMLASPYPMEAADGMMSDRFCYEKALREFVLPLEFENEQSWLIFCRSVWQWNEKIEERKLEAKVEELYQQITEDPEIAERIKERLVEKRELARNGK